MYKFLALCFGVKHEPFVFDRLGKAVRTYLQINGVRIITYLDDMLVLVSSYEDCIRDALFVLKTLVKLGFTLKKEKCV